jgi:hypothetical protein
MDKPQYRTYFGQWDDLIAIGRSNGLTDDEIANNLVNLEESYTVTVPIRTNIWSDLFKKKGIIKKNRQTRDKMMTEQELFELELETEEGECFTLGYAIGRYCVKQLLVALLGDKNG